MKNTALLNQGLNKLFQCEILMFLASLFPNVTDMFENQRITLALSCIAILIFLAAAVLNLQGLAKLRKENRHFRGTLAHHRSDCGDDSRLHPPCVYLRFFRWFRRCIRETYQPSFGVQHHYRRTGNRSVCGQSRQKGTCGLCDLYLGRSAPLSGCKGNPHSLHSFRYCHHLQLCLRHCLHDLSLQRKGRHQIGKKLGACCKMLQHAQSDMSHSPTLYENAPVGRAAFSPPQIAPCSAGLRTRRPTGEFCNRPS